MDAIFSVGDRPGHSYWVSGDVHLDKSIHQRDCRDSAFHRSCRQPGRNSTKPASAKPDALAELLPDLSAVGDSPAGIDRHPLDPWLDASILIPILPARPGHGTRPNRAQSAVKWDHTRAASTHLGWTATKDLQRRMTR